MSPKGWADSKIGYDWLTNVYDSNVISKAHCPGEPRLLILMAMYHTSTSNSYGTIRTMTCVFCLSPHSTHLLQPLDIGLFSPLQTHFQKVVEDYSLTNVGITRDLFFPLYKKARTLAYTKENIAKAFQKCGINPFNPRTILGDLPKSSRQPSKSTFPPRQDPVYQVPAD